VDETTSNVYNETSFQEQANNKNSLDRKLHLYRTNPQQRFNLDERVKKFEEVRKQESETVKTNARWNFQAVNKKEVWQSDRVGWQLSQARWNGRRKQYAAAGSHNRAEHHKTTHENKLHSQQRRERHISTKKERHRLEQLQQRWTVNVARAQFTMRLLQKLQCARGLAMRDNQTNAAIRIQRKWRRKMERLLLNRHADRLRSFLLDRQKWSKLKTAACKMAAAVKRIQQFCRYVNGQQGRLQALFEKLWKDVEMDYMTELHKTLSARNIKWTEAQNDQIRLSNRQRSVRTAGTITFDPMGAPLVVELSKKEIWEHVPKLPQAAKQDLQQSFWKEAKQTWTLKRQEFERDELGPQLFEAVRQSHYHLSREEVKLIVNGLQADGAKAVLGYLTEHIHGASYLLDMAPPPFEATLLSREKVNARFRQCMEKAVASGSIEVTEAEWAQPPDSTAKVKKMNRSRTCSGSRFRSRIKQQPLRSNRTIGGVAMTKKPQPKAPQPQLKARRRRFSLGDLSEFEATIAIVDIKETTEQPSTLASVSGIRTTYPDEGANRSLKSRRGSLGSLPPVVASGQGGRNPLKESHSAALPKKGGW
jgi:hypothetical protein